MIEEGRVTVNGAVVRTPARWIDPRRDRVAVDRRLLRSGQRVYLALHKPAGYVTTRSDELHRPTVYDLLPQGHPWVFPVGRLDRDTTGLLLFTNDTRFGEAITGPGGGVPKTYQVGLDRPLSAADKRTMEQGMKVPGLGMLKQAEIEKTGEPGFWEITLHEGRNRQVRRMFETLGYTVEALHRVSIGPIHLGTLAPGKVRPLTSREIESIGRP
jgi:23S rRNA pseudouridine2605 synthase